MADPDGDKLTNIEEFRLGTNPLNPDTDNGGCWDGWEVFFGFDPTDWSDDVRDQDLDGWSNAREFLEGTDPRDPNTDGDAYPLDSLDPHPLLPDGAPSTKVLGGIGPCPIPEPIYDAGAPIEGGFDHGCTCQCQGEGNGQSQGRGLEEGSACGQGQAGCHRILQPPPPRDADLDGLVEFIDLL